MMALRIAYVSVYDPQQVQHWSGSSYYLARALEQQGFEIHYIGPLRDRWAKVFKVKKLLYRLAGKNYLRDREPRVLQEYAAQVDQALAGLDVDLVFSTGTREVCFLQSRRPIVFWTDANFAGMVDFYPDFSNLCQESLRHGHGMEQAALNNCRLAIYTSAWARESALAHYQVDPGRVQVIPFGANIDEEPAVEDVRGYIRQRPTGVCRLLFQGADWRRKGGPLAVRVAEELQRQGLPVQLDIVGCQPPGPLPGCVKVHGFIPKSTPEGWQQLRRFYSEAHFLLLPSRSEAFGLALAEACAYGVPCITSDVGGIPSIVRQGVNGYMLPLSAGPEAYAGRIQELYNDPPRYQEMALAAHQEFQQRLNWRVAGQRAGELFTGVCS
jgi:glycosyltransferase involved in cell wall biosynthesis